MPTTSLDNIYSAFFDKIENDIDFFNYFNLDENQSMEIAKTRANTYMNEALSLITFKCSPDVNFKDCDYENGYFNFELTPTEIDLIANVMFEMYLKKDLAKLKPIINAFSSTEIKLVYSPNEERKTFMNMLEQVKQENRILLADYAARDRLTGKRKTIEYKN